jgi:hypothetical protein
MRRILRKELYGYIGTGLGIMDKYAIEIVYSEEDDVYIAIVPELPGCSAFGRN